MSKLFKEVERRNTNCCKWDLCEEKLGIKKEEINSYWIADSDYETCPKIKREIIKRAKHGIFGYSTINCEYYEVLNNWVSSHYGYNVSKDNSVITSGVVNALNFIVKTFTETSDNIIINPPVYNPFYAVIRNNNRNIVCSSLIKTDISDTLFTYNIDYIDLEEKIKTAKMYILCNPHNPVGRCYKYEEIEKIVNLCKKYDCILVSDEIHCDLIMKDFKHTSAGLFFNQYDKIIVCTSPSKTFNIAGLGNSNIFFGNKDMHKTFKKNYEELEIIHSLFGVVAAEAAYKYGESWANEQNKHLYEQSLLVKKFAEEHKIKICKFEATYLMWLDLSRLKISQEELINGLIKKKIWINSGTIYDENSQGFIRLNIACSKKQLIKGLKLIGEFISECDEKR